MRLLDYDALWNWLESTVAAREADTWSECTEALFRNLDLEYDGDSAR